MSRISHRWNLRLYFLAAFIVILLPFQFFSGINVILSHAAHTGSKTTELETVTQTFWWRSILDARSLRVHVAFGLLFLVATSVHLVCSFVSRQKIWIVTALSGWVLSIVASVAGMSFLINGRGVSSFLMAVGLLAAGLSYAVGLFSSLFNSDNQLRDAHNPFRH